ncbi:MAG TPA: hypothetical protein PKM43_16210 [Verrucomicrobiota bacterium]|nr:hypothetical protein [Verrucomicrobiota bacterium]HRZ35678.1 hypothetical protein [Candidatus Paceibacterota bacterium]HRZ57045.1 hypothetical protein [Candidatus Paceibacterota bacterium]
MSLIDCDHRTPAAADTGYPYIAIPQLKEGRIDLSDVRRISPEHFAEWTRKAKPQRHDVILSRRCNPGETAYVPAGLEAALGQNLVLLRSDGTKLFPPFLRWLVRGPDWWEQIGTFINVGAVFDSLKCADNRAIATQEVIEELIKLAQAMSFLDAGTDAIAEQCAVGNDDAGTERTPCHSHDVTISRTDPFISLSIGSGAVLPF